MKSKQAIGQGWIIISSIMLLAILIGCSTNFTWVFKGHIYTVGSKFNLVGKVYDLKNDEIGELKINISNGGDFEGSYRKVNTPAEHIRIFCNDSLIEEFRVLNYNEIGLPVLADQEGRKYTFHRKRSKVIPFAYSDIFELSEPISLKYYR